MALTAAVAGAGGRLLGQGDPATVELLSLALAAIGAGVFGAEFFGVRWRRPTFWILGALACAAWTNWGNFQFERPIHPTDYFHYELGAEYFEELGYTRLYDCALAAIRVQGADLTGWTARDLVDNTLVPVEALEGRMRECPERFGPERWRAFRLDVATLGQAMGQKWFKVAVNDHGFNAPPTWVLLAHGLTRARSVLGLPRFSLVWVDVVLMAGTALVVLLAFSARTFALFALFLGCHVANRFDWTGGSLLRWDWFCGLTVALALFARVRRPLGAAPLAWAAALRLFPGVAVLGLVVSGAAWKVRLRALAAVGVSLVALGIATLWFDNSTQLWTGFVENTRKHQQTPMFNNLGLATLVASSGGSPPAPAAGAEATTSKFDAWAGEHVETLRRRQVVWWGLAGLAVAAFVVAMRRTRRLAPAMALGSALVPMLFELSCYYMAVLALLAVPAHGSRRLRGGLMAAIAGSQLLQVWQRHLNADRPELFFTLLAVIDVALCVGFLAQAAARRQLPPSTQRNTLPA